MCNQGLPNENLGKLFSFIEVWSQMLAKWLLLAENSLPPTIAWNTRRMAPESAGSPQASKTNSKEPEWSPVDPRKHKKQF